MFKQIVKRDGRRVKYDVTKIANAIYKCLLETDVDDMSLALKIAMSVEEKLKEECKTKIPRIEQIQDFCEKTLMEFGYHEAAKKYILYRENRTAIRESQSVIMSKLDEIIHSSAIESDLKRDNANVDGDTAMGSMLQIGATASKEYYSDRFLTEEQKNAHRNGDIHIHDFDFYGLTMTCCQIDVKSLFKDGFNTGHGNLREPNSIASYGSLAAIAIQANQNEMHGGQAIPNFDYGMAPGVAKSFISNLCLVIDNRSDKPLDLTQLKKDLRDAAEDRGWHILDEKGLGFVKKETMKSLNCTKPEVDVIVEKAIRKTDRDTYQAMEAFVHNMNTLHSRAGAQVPFSSVNYGMDTSEEGRMIIKNLLLTTESGLGNGETAIFPIQIFRVKEGINYNPEDANYDLFKLACKVSAKRLFPNFAFVDAPFNLAYYKGTPETEIAYMGCRTRVMSNIHDKEKEQTFKRGNLSFTSINLPRLAIEAKGDEEKFFKSLENMMALVCRQLLDRFEIQAKRKVKNFPFLMGQGVWLDSETLKPNDEVREVIKHGTLSVGFIGLAETLVALYGHHHGEGEEYQEKGLKIVGFMRDYLDNMAEKTKLNFSLLATPAEGLSGRFVRMDRKKYGVIEGVTDRDYYTNSTHIPVYFEISAFDKIRLEAPYHALENAGHIAYVELDGDVSQNLEAFEAVVRCMKEQGVGYGSINHPVDRCPCCGYNGIIGDECPKCHHTETEKVVVEKIKKL